MLKANVKTIDVVSHENGVVVFQDNGHESRFVPHSTGPLSDVQRTLESQLSDATASVKENMRKCMLNHLLQTMIVPNVEIEFSNILFGKVDISVERKFSQYEPRRTCWIYLARST